MARSTTHRVPRTTVVSALAPLTLTGAAAASAVAPVFLLSTLDGSNGFSLYGVNPDDDCGFSLAPAGDVNGDGYDDIIIGSRYADDPIHHIYDDGAAYILFGGPGVGMGTPISATSLNGSNGFVFRGVNMNDRAGFSVAGAGDVNGDGYDDVIIGAPEAHQTLGEAYIVFGHAPSPCAGDISGDGLTNSADFNMLASHFGEAVLPYTNGDLTGDGLVNSADFDILAGDFGCGPN